MAKRGGHATNYMGSAWMVSKHLRVELRVFEEFQSDYFNAFPGISKWHKEVQRELQDQGKLTTALGRERTFFGRLNSDETLKEAVAWYPQSTISDILKIGALSIWREMELGGRGVKLLADMHDGLLLSIPVRSVIKLVPWIIDLMTIPVKMPGGTMTIPVDITVGYRWSKDHMKKWAPGVLLELERPQPIDSLLDLDAAQV